MKFTSNISSSSSKILFLLVEMLILCCLHANSATLTDSSFKAVLGAVSAENSASNDNITLDTTLERLTNNETLSSDEVEIDEDDPQGTYGYQRHPSKMAAVVIYFSVALIGIFGALIKYFVMQYESSQAKAQLEYQQLQNMKTY